MNFSNLFTKKAKAPERDGESKKPASRADTGSSSKPSQDDNGERRANSEPKGERELGPDVESGVESRAEPKINLAVYSETESKSVVWLEKTAGGTYETFDQALDRVESNQKERERHKAALSQQVEDLFSRYVFPNMKAGTPRDEARALTKDILEGVRQILDDARAAQLDEIARAKNLMDAVSKIRENHEFDVTKMDKVFWTREVATSPWNEEYREHRGRTAATTDDSQKEQNNSKEDGDANDANDRDGGNGNGNGNGSLDVDSSAKRSVSRTSKRSAGRAITRSASHHSNHGDTQAEESEHDSQKDQQHPRQDSVSDMGMLDNVRSYLRFRSGHRDSQAAEPGGQGNQKQGNQTAAFNGKGESSSPEAAPGRSEQTRQEPALKSPYDDAFFSPDNRNSTGSDGTGGDKGSTPPKDDASWQDAVDRAVRDGERQSGSGESGYAHEEVEPLQRREPSLTSYEEAPGIPEGEGRPPSQAGDDTELDGSSGNAEGHADAEAGNDHVNPSDQGGEVDHLDTSTESEDEARFLEKHKDIEKRLLPLKELYLEEEPPLPEPDFHREPKESPSQEESGNFPAMDISSSESTASSELPPPYFPGEWPYRDEVHPGSFYTDESARSSLRSGDQEDRPTHVEQQRLREGGESPGERWSRLRSATPGTRWSGGVFGDGAAVNGSERPVSSRNDGEPDEKSATTYIESLFSADSGPDMSPIPPAQVGQAHSDKVILIDTWAATAALVRRFAVEQFMAWYHFFRFLVTGILGGFFWTSNLLFSVAEDICLRFDMVIEWPFREILVALFPLSSQLIVTMHVFVLVTVLAVQSYIATKREREIWMQGNNETRVYFLDYLYEDPSWRWLPGVDPNLMIDVMSWG